MHILIVGMGDTGSRLAALLCAQGHTVTGMRRRPPEQAVVGDVQWWVQSAHQANFTPLRPIDWVYVILAPDAHDAAAYQQTFIDSIAPLTTALATHPVQRVVFVSSTSVHGEDHGETIDESTPPNATRYNGATLWHAEQAWRAAWAERLVVVRPSGIYGPQRDRLLRWLQSGKPVATGQWSNRIHVEDLAGFLAHLLVVPNIRPLYLASDDQPTPLDDVMEGLASQHGLPMVARLVTAQSGKKITNQALKQSGYVLHYPNWQQGYVLI
jgi:nucleoside-diphosphate-sugar epimerase